MTITGAPLTIDRARLRAGDAAMRDRFRRALDPVTPVVLGLSSRATLIVRKVVMRTPLPRQGSVDRFGSTLRDELRARVVTARRGTVGNDRTDLLFEDDSALEAAIVADWLDRPQAAARSWWVPVVGATSPPDRWRRTLFRDVRLLPPVIVRLVQSGHAVGYLARFADDELQAVATRLIDVLAPVATRIVPASGPAAQAKAQAPNSASAQRSPTATTAEQAQTLAAIALITRIAPEAVAAPSPALRRLLTVALVAVRRPALLTTTSFARALSAIGSRETPLWDVNTTPQVSVISTFEDTTPDQTARPEAPGKIASPARDRDAIATDRRPTTHSPSINPEADDSAPTSWEPSPSGVEPAPAEFAPMDGTTPRPIVETGFGGMFFLLNAFVALGLYGTLSDPRGSLRGLSPFELLDLIGRRWFGRAFLDDPLHALLCDLSGLDRGERPGAHFEPPEWTVPDDWRAPWPEGGAIRGGRWHSAGFALTGGARRWVPCFARYLEARLVRALGEHDAVVLLCRRPARIVCDGDEVEIGLILDMHPLAIRLAGLDRDPGWLPAAGRRIGFVFS